MSVSIFSHAFDISIIAYIYNFLYINNHVFNFLCLKTYIFYYLSSKISFLILIILFYYNFKYDEQEDFPCVKFLFMQFIFINSFTSANIWEGNFIINIYPNKWINQRIDPLKTKIIDVSNILFYLLKNDTSLVSRFARHALPLTLHISLQSCQSEGNIAWGANSTLVITRECSWGITPTGRLCLT